MSTATNLPDRMMWYFADPMCSWCWGFTPVIRKLKQNYGDQVPIALLLGGLRPFTEQAISVEQREDILQHWQNVHKLTGQSFSFAGALPEGFVYDTEPASRAVITVGHIKPADIFAYLESIHHAFYVEQRDVTNVEVLAELAHARDIDAKAFRAYFESPDAHKQVRSHFERTRQAGVRGFPTVVLQKDKSFTLLTSGFQPYADLVQKLEEWLQ